MQRVTCQHCGEVLESGAAWCDACRKPISLSFETLPEPSASDTLEQSMGRETLQNLSQLVATPLTTEEDIEIPTSLGLPRAKDLSTLVDLPKLEAPTAAQDDAAALFEQTSFDVSQDNTPTPPTSQEAVLPEEASTPVDAQPILAVATPIDSLPHLASAQIETTNIDTPQVLSPVTPVETPRKQRQYPIAQEELPESRVVVSQEKPSKPSPSLVEAAFFENQTHSVASEMTTSHVASERKAAPIVERPMPTEAKTKQELMNQSRRKAATTVEVKNVSFKKVQTVPDDVDAIFAEIEGGSSRHWVYALLFVLAVLLLAIFLWPSDEEPTPPAEASAPATSHNFETQPQSATATMATQGVVSVDVLLARGKTQFASGDFVAASASYRSVLQREKQNVTALLGLGNALYEQAGNVEESKQAQLLDESIELLREASKQAPKNTIAWYSLGVVYEFRAELQRDTKKQREEKKRAIEAYKAFLALRPKSELANIAREAIRELSKK